MYLALDGGPPCFPPGSSCPVVLWIPAQHSLFRVRGSHSLRRTFPDASTKAYVLLQVRNPQEPKSSGLGSSRFARRYSGNRFFFLFLQVLRCFSSLRYLAFAYRPFKSGGFPHSDIYGSLLTYSSP